jgi:hypothetical protein
MAPILFHGLNQLGLPVVCVERQAYQALKSLTIHKTDRNDARGLAHLARTGFFKPVHVKSLSAHAVRSLIIARKKTGRPASDLGKSDPRFGGRVRDPAASRAHRSLHRQGSSDKRGDRWSLCRHAGSDRRADCRNGGGHRDRRGHETYGKGLGGLPPADDNPRRRPTDRSRFCGRSRRSLAHPPIPRHRRLSGLGPQAVSVG